MSIGTLKDLENIDGFKVSHFDVDVTFRDQEYVHVDHIHRTVTFKIQDGPIKESSVNGCQVDTIIAVAKHQLIN